MIIASLQRLLKCRVEHLLVKIMNSLPFSVLPFHYPLRCCLVFNRTAASKYLFKLYCLYFVFSPCNRGGTQKLLAMQLGYTLKLCVLSFRMCLYALSWPFIVCGVCVTKHDCCECTYLWCINVVLVVYECCACFSHCCCCLQFVVWCLQQTLNATN